ncbi:MAG: nitroreductase/quinone reductase family protein [Chloroflexota bacterium]
MNGWGETEPAWWLNLQANPDATVVLTDGPREVRARAAEGEERDRLWAAFRDYPGWGEDIAALAARRPGPPPRGGPRAPSRTATGATHRGGHDPAVVTRLLETKLQPPPLRSSAVDRVRLLDRLGRRRPAPRARLDAARLRQGTLVAQWLGALRIPVAAAWVSLDATDATIRSASGGTSPRRSRGPCRAAGLRRWPLEGAARAGATLRSGR